MFVLELLISKAIIYLTNRSSVILSGVPITLADPYLKTSRAKEHLDALREELRVFYESKPYQFFTNCDLANRRYRIRCELEDTPDHIPLILGDVFYCLRSSLDQLAWCLAKLTVSYPRGTQFPILGERDDGRFTRQTTGVPAEAAAIIESLQPYNGRDAAAIRSHLLWRLNLMSNIDKHRRIPVHSSNVQFMFPEAIARVAEFENGDVMSIPLNKVPPKTKMPTEPDVSFHVIFGDSFEGIECDVETVQQIYDFVANNVIPRFARFF